LLRPLEKRIKLVNKAKEGNRSEKKQQKDGARGERGIKELTQLVKK